MFCKNCGNQLEAGVPVCSRCGATLGSAFCPSCGQPTLPGAVACANCGCRLSAVPAAAAEPKSKLVAVLLCFLLGSFGMHDFYLGKTSNGVVKIVLSCCTCVGGLIWSYYDLIQLLTNKCSTDAAGVPLKKEF